METQHGHLQILTPADIDAVLDRGWHAHLACRHWRELYLVPLTYVHDGEFLYCHTLLGKKIKMMRSNPHVCLQIEEVTGVFRWRSIMIWGRFEELKGIEAAKCMSLLSKRIAEIEKERGLSPVEDEISAVLSSAIFYRIRIEKATGRAEGFENAAHLAGARKHAGSSPDPEHFGNNKYDRVDEASWESFPASDAPAW